KFDFLRSWLAFVKENEWVNNWGNTSPVTFIQLREDADPVKVESKIKDFIYRYQEKDKAFVTELALQRYDEKYLHSTFKNGKIDGGRIEYVSLFAIVAIFILLIACINFMNLATARSAKRAKEVGIRKVVGARRSTLIGQFAGEAILLTFISTIIAVSLAAILLPAFNNLTGKQLALPFEQPFFWTALFGLLVVTGFVSGSYPALFLSSLNPVRVLKGSLKFGWGAIFLRKGLVVFQFTLSIILIVGMIVIYSQMNYVQSKNLGYDRENLVYIPIEGELSKKYDVFKEETNKIPGILTVSKMRNSPTIIEHHTGNISWPAKDQNLSVSFADAVVGYDFVKTMKLQLNEGRDFSTGYGTDSAGYLLNETAINKIGYKEPIGKTITWGSHEGKIIGVLKDFHFNSMHQTIEPLIVRLDENWNWGTILVRTKAGKTKAAIAGLEKICKALNPKFPFSYQFSDLEYTNLYKSEQVVNKLSDYFAFLAIFISCLGLFGLATFSAGQRTKEIGVRKVLGASVPNIVALLTGNFIKPVIIAILIAVPVSIYIMNQWLQGFAYKIDIKWWMFASAGLIAIVIAIITVSSQAIKAAIVNPVKSLRTE
ncbi:MAG: FtsX-like permease family protein, partial [Ferruginibacter sp.]